MTPRTIRPEKTTQLDFGLQYQGEDLEAWASGYIGQVRKKNPGDRPRFRRHGEQVLAENGGNGKRTKYADENKR